MFFGSLNKPQKIITRPKVHQRVACILLGLRECVKKKKQKSLNRPSPKKITLQSVPQPHLFILVIVVVVGCICIKGNLSRNFLRWSPNLPIRKNQRNEKSNSYMTQKKKYLNVQLLNTICRLLITTFILLADGSNLLKEMDFSSNDP